MIADFLLSPLDILGVRGFARSIEIEYFPINSNRTLDRTGKSWGKEFIAIQDLPLYSNVLVENYGADYCC